MKQLGVRHLQSVQRVGKCFPSHDLLSLFVQGFRRDFFWCAGTIFSVTCSMSVRIHLLCGPDRLVSAVGCSSPLLDSLGHFSASYSASEFWIQSGSSSAVGCASPLRAPVDDAERMLFIPGYLSPKLWTQCVDLRLTVYGCVYHCASRGSRKHGDTQMEGVLDVQVGWSGQVEWDAVGPDGWGGARWKEE